MRTFHAVFIAFVLGSGLMIPMPCVAAEGAVEVRRITDDSYELTLRSATVADVGTGQWERWRDVASVVWRQQPNRSFLLVREEENVLEKATAAKLSADELARVRAKFGCRE